MFKHVSWLAQLIISLVEKFTQALIPKRLTYSSSTLHSTCKYIKKKSNICHAHMYLTLCAWSSGIWQPPEAKRVQELLEQQRLTPPAEGAIHSESMENIFLFFNSDPLFRSVATYCAGEQTVFLPWVMIDICMDVSYSVPVSAFIIAVYYSTDNSLSNFKLICVLNFRTSIHIPTSRLTGSLEPCVNI